MTWKESTLENWGLTSNFIMILCSFLKKLGTISMNGTEEGPLLDEKPSKLTTNSSFTWNCILPWFLPSSCAKITRKSITRLLSANASASAKTLPSFSKSFTKSSSFKTNPSSTTLFCEKWVNSGKKSRISSSLWWVIKSKAELSWF